MATGTFSGSPTQAGTYPVSITTTDCSGTLTTENFTWTVTDTGSCNAQWTTSVSDNVVTLTITQATGTGTRVTTVDWGDNSSPTVTRDSVITHTYPTDPSQYPISVTNTFIN